jgi:hypothetical protein
MKKLERVFTTFMLIFITRILTMACPVCEKSQPKITAGLTHGAGPQSNWDWIIIGVITGITLLTLIFSVKFLVKPGEENIDHIKKSILIN